MDKAVKQMDQSMIDYINMSNKANALNITTLQDLEQALEPIRQRLPLHIRLEILEGQPGVLQLKVTDETEPKISTKVIRTFEL